MKILLLGKNGQVGWELQRSLAPLGKVIALGIPAASIGPITTQTARSLGVEVAIQAKVYTVEGLVDAVMGLLH